MPLLTDNRPQKTVGASQKIAGEPLKVFFESPPMFSVT